MQKHGHSVHVAHNVFAALDHSCRLLSSSYSVYAEGHPMFVQKVVELSQNAVQHVKNIEQIMF